MFAPPAKLDTARLVLRRPVRSDAAEVYESFGRDERVARFLLWKPHRGVEDAEAFIERRLEGWERGGEYTWVMVLRFTGRVVGALGARPDHGINIGFLLAHEFWGRGLATEAVRAFTEWGLSQEGIYRIWAVCQMENAASARVLEKAGMNREGVLRRWAIHPNISDQEPQDCYCYAKTR